MPRYYKLSPRRNLGLKFIAAALDFNKRILLRGCVVSTRDGRRDSFGTVLCVSVRPWILKAFCALFLEDVAEIRVYVI